MEVSITGLVSKTTQSESFLQNGAHSVRIAQTLIDHMAHHRTVGQVPISRRGSGPAYIGYHASGPDQSCTRDISYNRIRPGSAITAIDSPPGYTFGCGQRHGPNLVQDLQPRNRGMLCRFTRCGLNSLPGPSHGSDAWRVNHT